MAIPVFFDLNYYRGDTLIFYINAKDNEGNTIDLDGWTPLFTIASARGPNPSFSVSATASIAESIITCTLPPAVGEQLINNTYVYDVQVSNGSTNVYTYLTGNVYVTLDVSEA